jgi:hypothetical protein
MNAVGKGQVPRSSNLKVPGRTHNSSFKRTSKSKFIIFFTVICILIMTGFVFMQIFYQNFYSFYNVFRFYEWVMFYIKFKMTLEAEI